MLHFSSLYICVSNLPWFLSPSLCRPLLAKEAAAIAPVSHDPAGSLSLDDFIV